MKKYELTEETKVVDGFKIHRIKSLKDFGDVREGDLGGWIEYEHNLSHEGNCWAGGEACVSGNAVVSGNAYVAGFASVFGEARVFGNACVNGFASVFGEARVFGNAWVTGDAVVYEQDSAGEKGCVAYHDLPELEIKVIQWAKARQIIPNAKPESQVLKAVSEMGELADAVLKGQEAEMKDAVGDVLVCLINLCALKGTSLGECLSLAYDQIKGRKGTLLPNGCFVKEEEK